MRLALTLLASLAAFSATVTAAPEPFPIPWEIASANLSPEPSPEDRRRWAEMVEDGLVPRGCPGGDGNTCCPAGQFAVSELQTWLT